MPELFGGGGPATVIVVVAALLVVLVLARPGGRGVLAALAGQVARWPGMIRAEMRGAAPLGVEGGPDGPVDGTDPRRRSGDTTPDIPAVTRGFPVVERPDRV